MFQSRRKDVALSGLSFRRACFFALRFQLRELLGRKNGFGAAQEIFAALRGTTCFHAFALPCFDFVFLICRQVQACQINASDRTTGCAFCATCMVLCKRAGRSQHRSCD